MNYSIFSKNKGFTLTELLVVIGIATVLMTAIIFKQNGWNDQLSVNTQAYEMVLSIRQAQIYSLGVREYTAGTGDKFNLGYGIYLDEDNLNQYVFFADKDGDQKYDIGEAVETKTFTRGVTINRFCGLNPGLQERCSPDAGNVYTLHLSFLRPEPKANIVLLNNGGNMSASINPPAIIYLRSVGGKESRILVELSGQISITQ
ncbi:MAG: hypothetical protein A3F20_04295 [Candidatus Zambryskibacteria bacterium RIFCSPHIGHO2_12_FULL_39_21]|nr:MAG: hypothetical protein UT00_C0028G0005 [Parcubacteria group bacterium GW2011_GWA1_38_7]OHA95355.1 MAG: hypothetical protein A3B88_02665 [Candidatus Zambryskibacteria bacterium RIFCSPHIGHO2_02_FULL_39_19]OHA97967.1 MAG: hypothetical protein A3F20_04295 [Candidatus Zambryskibacteria bacterium RIFCSPHIGHO2_12_FULL_39_21]